VAVMPCWRRARQRRFFAVWGGAGFGPSVAGLCLVLLYVLLAALAALAALFGRDAYVLSAVVCLPLAVRCAVCWVASLLGGAVCMGAAGRSLVFSRGGGGPPPQMPQPLLELSLLLPFMPCWQHHQGRQQTVDSWELSGHPY
jgi:hypothetical protein